jgi:hypothetical protein
VILGLRLRHNTQLRNVIECIFSVLKRQFKVLLIAQEYPFAIQACIISAIAFLHNFIVIHDSTKILSNDVKSEPSIDNIWSSYQAVVPCKEQTRAAECRDHIARAMWEDYTLRAPHRCR